MDAEKVVCVHLHDRLSVPAHYDMPGDRPDELVTVVQTGGGSDAFGIGRKSVLVQCWAQTRERAAEIAEEAKDAVRSLVELDNVTGARIASEYRDRDMDSGTPRRCLMVEINVNE